MTIYVGSVYQILNDGTNSRINNTTGKLMLKDDTIEFVREADDTVSFKVNEGGTTDIYHNHNLKLQTSSTGISVTGAIVASGDVTAFSDLNLKTDIHTINNALDICGKLRGVNYKWKEDNKPSIGVIAQEVEQVIPEIVLTQQIENKGKIKSVDYGKIVGVLINAINELREEVNQLKGDK